MCQSDSAKLEDAVSAGKKEDRIGGPHELTIPASAENVAAAAAFVEDRLCEGGCPFETLAEINIAVDELLSNIVNYSGASVMIVGCKVAEGAASVYIEDDGTPYDPLKTQEPDTSLADDERAIGGLGILLVKKTMDSTLYEHRGGRNVLTIKKIFASRL